MSALLERALEEADLRLEIGDVIYNTSRKTRKVVVGWSPRGKLVMRAKNGNEVAYWWKFKSDLPKSYKLIRGGVMFK